MTNIQEKPNPTPGPWRFTRVDINVNRIGHYVENVAGRMDALWSDTTSHAVAVPAHPAQHGFGSFGFTPMPMLNSFYTQSMRATPSIQAIPLRQQKRCQC